MWTRIWGVGAKQRAWIVLVIAAVAGALSTGCGSVDADPTGSVSLASCNGVKLATSPALPSDPGTAVTLTASGVSCASGESAEYRFAYKQDGTTGPYQLIRDYGASPSATWSTSGLPAGKYLLAAYARASGSTAGFQSMAYATFYLKDVCTSAKLGVSPAPPQPAGTAVTLSGSATCTGAATPEYRFFYKPQQATSYTEISPYSSNASATWDTSGLPSGAYNLLLYARAAGNQSTVEAIAYGNYSLGSVCTAVTLATAPISPRPVGTTVGLTANATCGGASAEYRFLVRPSTSQTYTEIQGYSSAATATWSTAGLAPGNYFVVVYARAAGSNSIAETTGSVGYVLGIDVSATAGVSHTCALSGGRLKCFGRSILGTPTGQFSTDRGLDASDMGDGLPAVDLGTGHTALAVAHGAYHACAILENGAVKCWGSNGSGELGLGDRRERTAGSGDMGDALPTVALGTGKKATRNLSTRMRQRS